MPQQTAVEWLIEQVNGYSYPIPYNQNIRIDIPKEIIEQAKEMEKEQLEQAYMHGLAWMMPEGSERVTIVKSKWDI